jgi:hypothetical protein
MRATARRRLSHRDGLHDDTNPRREHAEAVAQWQSPTLRLMWAAAFGLALWHSGDSAFVAVISDSKAAWRHYRRSLNQHGHRRVVVSENHSTDDSRLILEFSKLDTRMRSMRADWLIRLRSSMRILMSGWYKGNHERSGDENFWAGE